MNGKAGDQTSLRDGTVLRQIAAKRNKLGGSASEPTNAFEAVTRQMVVDLHGEIQALRARIDSLFSVVVGAIVLDLLLRLAGWR